jgi:hypothetical protein
MVRPLGSQGGGGTVLVVVAPSGDGTKHITVRQADSDGAPSVTSPDAFSYIGQGTGEEPSETPLDGPWKAYGIGHQYPDTTLLLESDLAFAGGTFTQSANTWYATPLDPDGTTAQLGQSGPFRVFADGTLWMKGSDQDFASRSFLTDERDVFIVANDASTTGPIWLGAGIRRASGMSNASLTGTWHLGLFSHSYAMDPDERTISSAWGTAEFDGMGHGSAGLIGAACQADPDSEDQREPIGSTLTYEVAADGTFTITIPEPDDGGEPIVFRGSLAQARDLAVAVTASGGQAQFLMMIPTATGFGPPYVQGSWYGGGLAYEYEPFGPGNVFMGETIRSLHDGHGEGVGEAVVRITSDEDENGGVETEVHGGRTLCEATGLLIGGPDDLSGFIGPSRRFQIFLPANLEPYPWADPIEFMGASLMLRRPAVYSSWTIGSTGYNAVGISTEYKAPGEPLSLYEENTSFRTRLHFTASDDYGDDESDLIGVVREAAGDRYEKIVYREPNAYFDIIQREGFGEFRGPYAVLGDGRILMSTEPYGDRLAVIEEDLFEQVVGEITGNADVIVLRNAVNPEGASALIVLARDGNPTLDGTYHGGALRFSYAEDSEYAQAGFGSVSFNADDGNVSGTGTLFTEVPGGQVFLDEDTWGTYPYSMSGGVITSLGHPTGVLTGIATPDGEAFFLVDLSETYHTTLLLGLKQPSAPVASAGSYRVAGFAHDYVTNGTLPVEAAKYVMSGHWRITDSLDAGYDGDERNNTDEDADRTALLFADNYLAVNTDGSLSWTAVSPPVVGLSYWRGWLSRGGKYGFLMPADQFDGIIYPADIAIHILTR